MLQAIDVLSVLFRYFSYFVAVHWCIVSCYVIVGLIGFIFYRQTQKSIFEETDLELCIVSKASKDVEDQLIENISYHKKMFPEYKMNVIVDEGSSSLKRLKQSISNGSSVNLVIVPKRFKCKAIAKGRAIQYFIENHVVDSTWYAFIDDDNRILDRTFLKEIPCYDAKGYGASNGILLPRTSGNDITFVADSLRYFDDKTIFRFGTGLLKMPLNGFHGELLISKGEYLRKITFNRKSVTEDFSYASELMKHKIKVWQSSTMISIFSPVAVTDFFKQRNRWFRGISHDVRKTPLKMKLFSGIRIIDWTLGIFGSWVIFPLWFFMPIPLWLILFNFIGASYYYGSYLWGISHLEDWTGKIKGILCIPIYSTMETLSPWIHTNGFNVIDKNGLTNGKNGIRYQ